MKKRVLVKDADESISELELLEKSPSGEFIKVYDKYNISDKATYWVSVDKLNIIEEL